MRDEHSDKEREEVLFKRGIFTAETVPVTLWCEELCTVNDDTCDGHGAHRGSPRHGNGGEAL